MLSDKQAHQIRYRLTQGETPKNLAAEFTVTIRTIYNIRDEVTHYSDTKDSRRLFTDNDAAIIRERVDSGETMYALAKEYKTAFKNIQNIMQHLTYQEKPDQENIYLPGAF